MNYLNKKSGDNISRISHVSGYLLRTDIHSAFPCDLACKDRIHRLNCTMLRFGTYILLRTGLRRCLLDNVVNNHLPYSLNKFKSVTFKILLKNYEIMLVIKHE